MDTKASSKRAPQPFLALEMLARAKQLEAEGRTIVHLEAGEPAISAAPAVREAIANHVLNERQPYTEAKGMLALRAALADYYRRRHAVAVDPEAIIVTTGSSSGFVLGFLGGFETGDRIGITRPGYPAYLNILTALGFEPVEIEVRPEDRWRLTVEAVERAHATAPLAGLMVESPANPTGAILPRDGLAALVELCDAHGIRIVSDEVYHGLSFGMECVSALELTREAIVVNSFSKYYCMTGWRVGWMVLPEALVRGAQILAQSLFISAPTASQVGAIAALGATDYYEAEKVRYARNREVLVAGLKRLGFTDVPAADGGFYEYADVSALSNDSNHFCHQLLEEAGVAATPGIDFDRKNGHKYVRFSYAGDREAIEAAVEKMAGFLGRPG